MPVASRFNTGLEDRGLFGDVVNRLGEDIVTGRIPEGEILYVEQVCRELGISRSVVREGFRILAAMGLIESRPQRGTKVLPIPSWDLLNSRVIRWRARSAGYLAQQRELLELRLGIESVAARLAATRIPEAEAEAIARCAEEMERCFRANDRQGFFRADAEFHGSLLEGSGNRVLAQFAETISANLMARSYDPRPGTEALYEEAVRRHVKLADAIAARDPEAAEAWAREIVAGTLEEFSDQNSMH